MRCAQTQLLKYGLVAHTICREIWVMQVRIECVYHGIVGPCLHFWQCANPVSVNPELYNNSTDGRCASQKAPLISALGRGLASLLKIKEPLPQAPVKRMEGKGVTLKSGEADVVVSISSLR